MNFTVANHNEAKNPNDFIAYDTVEFTDIPEMVTSGFAYSAGRFVNNHRSNANWLGCVDVLILDVDSNCSIEQAKSIFAKYEFYIITTRSHLKDKGGISCDRFRIFLHLQETINEADEYDELINNAMAIYPFVDKACKDRGRFYFSSPKEAEIFYNEGSGLPVKIILNGVESKNIKKEGNDKGKDKNNHIKHLNEVFVYNELTEQWINKFGEVLENDKEDVSVENKIKGALTILDNNFYAGNRNNCVFSVCCMLKKDGLDENYITEFMIKENDRRDGLKFNELMQAIKSAFRIS